VLGITGEYLDRGRSNRADADNPRTIGDSKTKNQTIYLNGELPTIGTGRCTSPPARKAAMPRRAWARGGIGSDDIPSRNSAAMYPNGFVPFINAQIDDQYAILGHRNQVGEWNMDLSQTYG
jgi:iron complex outermembrane receptor protein